jgi:hypothetical protein
MQYIDQIGDAQFPPPYRFPRVQILSFTLQADLVALKFLCDRMLNIGSPEERGFEYRPVLPFVQLEMLHYPRMEYGGGDPGVAAAMAADPLSLDYTSQDECYVKMFVMKHVWVGGWLVPDGELAVFCPFLLVNNTWSAFSGRDVMGFPKLFGVFEPPVRAFFAYLTGTATDPASLDIEQRKLIQRALPSKPTADGEWGPQTRAALDDFLKKSKMLSGNPNTDPVQIAPQTLTALKLDPGHFRPTQPPTAKVRTLAFENFNPNSKACLCSVVSIEKKTLEERASVGQAGGNGEEAPTWPWWGTIVGLLRSRRHSVSQSQFHDLKSVTQSVQVKQFRDPGDPEKACYQTIIGSRITLETIESAGFLPDVWVTITDYPTLQLAASLGIRSGKKLSPISPSYFTCTFRFTDARALFINSDAGGYEQSFWPMFPWTR